MPLELSKTVSADVLQSTLLPHNVNDLLVNNTRKWLIVGKVRVGLVGDRWWCGSCRGGVGHAGMGWAMQG